MGEANRGEGLGFMAIIKVEHLYHTYMEGTPFRVEALHDINLEISCGEFIGLAGQTGSGKSTLIQHFNGLLRPTQGKIYVDGLDLGSKDVNMREIRRKVGLVFQYPEHQLFEETVYADVAFGPRNLGLSAEEVDARVREAIATVGLDFEQVKDRSPFEMSGGQMRRVAIAGVLAMRPSVLILDEPAAGLDPRGRDEILDQVRRLHDEKGLTIILVSHSMEDIARLVERVIVMREGKIVLDGKTRDIFRREDILRSCGLGIPDVTRLMRELVRRGLDVRDDVLTVGEAKEELLRALSMRGIGLVQ